MIIIDFNLLSLGEKLGVEYLYAQTKEQLGQVEKDPDKAVEGEELETIEERGEEDWDEDPTVSNILVDFDEISTSNPSAKASWWNCQDICWQ